MTYDDSMYEKLSRIGLNISDNRLDDELELMFKLEENRWLFMSNSSSNQQRAPLNYSQFYLFSYPNEDERIRFNDAKFVFDYYDLDHNGLIEYAEFKKAIKGIKNGFQKGLGELHFF